MTLAAEGVQRLVDERSEELSELQRAQQAAKAIVEKVDDGILERELVKTVVRDAGVSRSAASSATDYLRAIGAVRKDWTTGFLTLLLK